ncbi:MAG: hypothetical protein IJ489_09195 [Clostridia bacterium]|nr:hypothetical protein [Clostridia bacterium]
MNRSEKWREHLRSMIVGILLLVLICLCVIYILSFSGVEEFEFSAQDMEAVSNESIRYQYLDYWNRDFVSPAFIGFSWKKLGDNVGFYTLGGENEDVYQSVLPFFEKLFGKEGEMEKLSRNAGEKLFHSLMKGSYIYLSYACDLPTSVICSLTEEADFSGESGEYISEILIVPEEYLWQTEIQTLTGETEKTVLYSFYAVARDRAGNYYRYSTKFLPKTPTDIAFHTNFYLTYNEAEDCLPYEFAYVLKQDDFLQKTNFSEKVTDTTIIPLGNISHSAPVVFAESRIASGTDMNPILENFYMNPEQTTSYTDENGVIFYFDEGQTVSVAPGGTLHYSSHGPQGISLETVFGWHTGEKEYAFFDYLGAALIASHQLKDAHSKTNCKLYLAGIDYDGEALTIRFGYAAGGFPLYFNGEKTIMSFTFSGDMMQSAEYRFWTVHMTALVSEAPDFLLTLRAHLDVADEQKRYFYGYYFSKERSRVGIDVLSIPQTEKE